MRGEMKWLKSIINSANKTALENLPDNVWTELETLEQKTGKPVFKFGRMTPSEAQKSELADLLREYGFLYSSLKKPQLRASYPEELKGRLKVFYALNAPTVLQMREWAYTTGKDGRQLRMFPDKKVINADEIKAAEPT